jgi:hypothetical protein
MEIRATPLEFTGLTLLGLVNAWLVAAVVADVVPDDEDHENLAEIVTPAKLEGSLDGASTSKAYDQILSRPIFFKSREPFIPPPPDATTSQSKANSTPVFADPGLVLGGVMISKPTDRLTSFKSRSLMATGFAKAKISWDGSSNSSMKEMPDCEKMVAPSICTSIQYDNDPLGTDCERSKAMT